MKALRVAFRCATAIVVVATGCGSAPESDSPMDAASRPRPTLLVQKPGLMSALFIEGAWLYLGGPGFIDRASLAGGSVEPLFATDSDWPCDIASDVANLYWGSATNAPSLRTGPKSGGEPTTLADARYPTSLIVKQADVYFRDSGGVYRVPADGSSPPQLLAAIQGSAGWADGVGCRVLAMVGANLFTAYHDTDAAIWRVVRVPMSGAQFAPLHEFTYQPGALLADSTSIYWADTPIRGEVGGAALLWKGAIDGSTRAPFAEALGVTGGVITSIAMDSDAVYWTVKDSLSGVGAVGRRSKVGGDVEILYSNIASTRDPLGITIVGDRIYWISFDAGMSKVFSAPR